VLWYSAQETERACNARLEVEDHATSDRLTHCGRRVWCWRSRQEPVFQSGCARPSSPPAPVSDRQQQALALQQRRQEQEAELTILRQREQSAPLPSPVVRRRPPPAAAAPASPPSSSPALQTDESSASPVASTPLPVTEQTALNRVQHYLNDTADLSPPQRRERTQALIDDLRAMGEPAVTALLQLLESREQSRARRIAASLLGALQDIRALPALQDVLEREQDLVLRRAAAHGLRQLQSPETLPVLSNILANAQDDRLVRLSAAYGLAQLGEAQGTAGLIQIFQEAEQDGQGRFPAFRALMSLNDPATLPLMRQLAMSDVDVTYRMAAMRFLARQGDQEALPLLQRLLDSPREQPSILEAAAQTQEAIRSGQLPAAFGERRGRGDLFDIGLGSGGPARQR